MANASIIRHRFQKVFMETHLDTPGRIELGSSYSMQVKFSPDGNQCIGIISQKLKDRETDGRKFEMEVELFGIFSCNGATTDEVKRVIHSEVYDLLFPHLQAQCSNLASAAGLPDLMLRKSSIDPNSIEVNKDGVPAGKNPDGGPKLALLN